MRAYLMDEPGSLRLGDAPTPEIDGDGYVLLESEHTSICATDVAYYRGALTPAGWPIIPGHEYVGKVVDSSLPTDVVRVGERVTYWGQTDFEGLAQYRLVRPLFVHHSSGSEWFTDRGFMDDHAAATVVVDNNIPPDYATLLEPMTSVLRALLTVTPTPGDDAIVIGAGTCGLIALQLLRWQGVRSITVLDVNDHRLRLALDSGADAAFNVCKHGNDLLRLATDTRGNHAQYAFDSLPDTTLAEGPDTRALAMSLLCPKANYVLFGASQTPQRFDTWLLLSKGIRLQSTPFDVRAFPMRRTASVLTLAQRLLLHGAVDPSKVVSHVVPFVDDTEVKSAFDDHATGTRMKTVVRFREAASTRGHAS